MDPTNCDSKVLLEGPPDLMDFEECTTDEEICQFLTAASKAIDYYQASLKGLAELAKGKPGRPPLYFTKREKEFREKMDMIQVSNIDFCPIVNCATHVKNNARINSKRTLFYSEEELNLDNDATDLNSFKFPSKRLTAEVKINDATVSQENFFDSNKFSNLTNEEVGVGEIPQTQAPAKKPPQYC
ncbi:hypothetical protein AVEN_184007-1 [Araneus ventricosus]|uniref:Uncharacterized protein n=1 Tax=Araneus ventricosus TaxID=182803 RepID=A0A4Y2UJR7_ARAVE|nr:hypothetical protein AVEN_184007-1 [Araneus ventricosus]